MTTMMQIKTCRPSADIVKHTPCHSMVTVTSENIANRREIHCILNNINQTRALFMYVYLKLETVNKPRNTHKVNLVYSSAIMHKRYILSLWLKEKRVPGDRNIYELYS